MPNWLKSITDPFDPAQAELVRRRRYGQIEVRGGRLVRISFRLWPKFVFWLGLRWSEFCRPKRRPQGNANDESGDRCLVYYDQPFWHRNFLALKYVASSPGTSLRTLRAAAAALDLVARIKGSDAILCDVTNPRISNRALRRFGWAPLRITAWRRIFIRRFYGAYPALPDGEARSGPVGRQENRGCGDATVAVLRS
ncbi:MAG: hypothetical protein HYS13_24625 [Planctomycetia bacterium]|nr:hypothetical protein [Planctomycetia bacterium]